MAGTRPSRPTEGYQNSQELISPDTYHRQTLDVNTVNILYTNADCLTNKTDDLLLMLNSLDYKPSIIAITEVNSKIYSNNKQVSEFNIAGYTIFSANIGSQDHRGIILYIHESVCACQVDIVTPFSECLFVQIKQLNRLVLTLGVTYRSPSSLSVNNMHLFDLFNTLTSNIHGRIIIVGDFNFRHIDWINCCMEGDSSPNIPAARFLDCLQKIT